MSSASPSPNSPVSGGAPPPSPPSSPPPIPPNSTSAPPPGPSIKPPPPLDPPGAPPPDPPGAPPPPPRDPPGPPPPPPDPRVPPPPRDPPGAPPPDPPNSPPTEINSPPPDPSNAQPPPVNPPPPAATPPPESPPPTPPPPSLPTSPVALSPPPFSNPPPPTPPRSPPPAPPDPPIPPPPPATNPPPSPALTPPQSPPPMTTNPPPRPPTNSPPPPPRNSPPPPTNSDPPSPIRNPRSSPPPPRNSPPPPVSPRSPPPSSNPILSPPPITIQLPPPPPATLSPPFVSPPTNTSSNNTVPANSSSPNSGGIGTGGTVAIAMVIGFLLLGIIGTVACCMWKRKKKSPGKNGGHIIPTSVNTSQESDSNVLKIQISSSSNELGSFNGGLGNSRTWFTYQELFNATNGFPAENLLGSGGFGSVYKGTLVDGREVAVKELKIGGGQGEREFRSEVEIISRIHHRHLVSLVGYCISENKRLLVYEYVANNTLYFHLHGAGRPVMDWATRVKIAIGAARGIAYLHEDCHPRIIHRDIKSSNILLDDNFEARVSDFGLAKLAMDANTHITTRVMGTFGYMAPEYASSGKLTEKSDVYSFGVVLLELITGRKPVDMSQPLGNESLVEWARPLLSHALETEEFGDLVDPKLEIYVAGDMFRMMEVAAACVRHSATKRPKMGQIVRAFDNLATSDLTNGMRVGESEIFTSAQQSAEIRLFQRMAFGSQGYSTDFFSQTSSSSERNPVNNMRD